MRRLVLVTSTLAALAALLPVRTRAADLAPIRLETLVPGKSLAFASVEQVGSLGRRFKATALGKMLDDPEMKAFGDPLAEDLKKLMNEKDGKGGLPIPPIALELLGKLTGLEGQAAVALVDVAEHRPVIAACLDFGGHLSDFVTFLTRVKDDPSGDKPPLHATEEGGRTWWTMGDPEQPMVFATTLGTALFLSTDKAWLTATATSNLAAVDGALSTTAPFQRVRAASGGEALAVSVYANVPSILARVPVDDQAKRIMDALGLGAVEAAGYGMAFVGDGILDSIVVDAPTTDHGLMTLMPTKPVTHAALAWAPSTAFYFGEASFDFGGFLPKLRDLLGRIDPDMAQEVERMLGKANGAIGMDLEKDLLAGFGDSYAAWLAIPETGGLYPELGVAFDVKDANAFEAKVAKAADALCAEVGKTERVTASRRVIEWHGKRLHVIDLAGVKRRKMVPFTPTICFTGGKMLVTLVPHAMKEILLRAEAGTANAGLGGQEDVKTLLASAPAGHASFAYLDLQAILNLAYDTAVPVLQTIAKPNVLGVPVRLDWAQLPPTRTMRPYFRSLGAFSVCDGKSLRISVHSPIGVLAPAAIVGVAAVGFMQSRAKRFEHDFSTMPVEVPPAAEGNAAQASADMLRDAVLAYVAATGKLPEGLADLTAKNPRTDEPYVKEVPLDPWGFGFVYTVVDAATASFEIRSWGSDGLPKTGDDVVATGAGK